MIKAKGLTFGDGLMEIIPDENAEKVIYLDDMEEVKREPERRKEGNRSAKKAPRFAFSDLHDTLVILSVVLPFVFGFFWSADLLQHEAVYIIYWQLTFAWMALVLYANKKERHGKKD